MMIFKIFVMIHVVSTRKHGLMLGGGIFGHLTIGFDNDLGGNDLIMKLLLIHLESVHFLKNVLFTTRH